MRKQTCLPWIRRAGWCLLALAVSLALSCGGRSKEALPPLSIGKLVQSRLLEGDLARGVINDIHPSAVAPVKAWVATYGGRDGVTIYASRFPDATAAETALGQMRAGMAEGTSGFGTSKAETVNHQAGYRTEGLNRSDFFFVRGNWMIWIEGRQTDFVPALKAMRWT